MKPPLSTQKRAADFSAVVLAGERGPSNPIAEASGVSCKAMALVGGKPMLERVVETLEESRHIDRVVISAASPLGVGQHLNKPLVWRVSQATPSLSARAAMECMSPDKPALLTTADHALLHPAIVDYFCTRARQRNNDVVIGLTHASGVNNAFPGIRRTRLKFSDHHYCGCNLFAFMTPQGRGAVNHWTQVERHRKKTWRLIQMLGWHNVVAYLMGQLSLEHAVGRLSKQLGVSVGTVLIPFPEAAVDVDTLDDLALAREIVSQQCP